MGLLYKDVALYAHKSMFLLLFFSSFKFAPGSVDWVDEMKAAGVLCRSLQRAVRMESPSVLLGKGGVSGGVSCDFVELGMAPGWSCPPAVVLKACQCHRAHF